MNQPLVSHPEHLGVVLVTAPSEAEAQRLAHHLVESGLAACVSITPTQSVYRWQGETQVAPEWQLLIKTDLTHFEALAQSIQRQHSYEVPEIIALPLVAGLSRYLDWVVVQTRPPENKI